MRQLAEGLWVAESPLRFVGLEVGARMTVVRLAGGELLVHSPIAATAERLAEVAEVGEVAHVVAPNRYHHLYVGEWQQAFPEAAVHVAPGLERKRSDLRIAGVLGDAPEPAWAGTLEQVRIEGMPLMSEVVFFHPASASLVLSDLAFHVGPTSPTATRWFFRLAGAYGRLAPTLLERLLVRDRAAFRRSLERILAWPFERVIVAHGEICESNAREQLVHGYRWAL